LPSAQQEQQLLAEEVKGRVLAISVSIKTFTDPPPADSGFVFDIDVCTIAGQPPLHIADPPHPPSAVQEYLDAIPQLLELDPALKKVTTHPCLSNP
jgi:hypothetical protein